MEIELGTLSSVDTTTDNVVIENLLEDLRGGRSLDVSGWPVDRATIPAGWPIYKDGGEYKPIELDEYNEIDDTNADLCVGVLVGTILRAKPIAAIMVRGTVNVDAADFDIPEACQAKLSLIRISTEE